MQRRKAHKKSRGREERRSAGCFMEKKKSPVHHVPAERDAPWGLFVVIRFAAEDRHGTIQLLGEKQAHHLVGKGET